MLPPGLSGVDSLLHSLKLLPWPKATAPWFLYSNMDPGIPLLMLQLRSSEESDVILSNLQELQAFPVLNFLSVK